jgi:hypothetical protein
VEDRSLFILSLPRSLSSRVFQEVRVALGLREPVWTTDGEILNNDRFILHTGPRADEGLKFTREEEAERCRRITAFLQDAMTPEGFIYKDVVQPFAASAWLRTKDFPVLKIRRRIEDVAFAMIQAGWLYPARAFPRASLTEAMLTGLNAAWKAIESVPGETVEFDDLISSDEALKAAVRRLYPGRVPQGLTVRDDGFERKKESILRRRETPLYRELAHQAAALRGFTPPRPPA